MIEFILEAVVCPTDDPEGEYQNLYKKMLWPVLPRTNDWFEIAETENSTANQIGEVWHWLNDDETPRIHVELILRLHDYEKLLKFPKWKKYWSEL